MSARYTEAAWHVPLRPMPHASVALQRVVLVAMAWRGREDGTSDWSISTYAAMASVTRRAAQYAVDALDAQHVIEPIGERSEGRRPTRWRLLIEPTSKGNRAQGAQLSDEQPRTEDAVTAHAVHRNRAQQSSQPRTPVRSNKTKTDKTPPTRALDSANGDRPAVDEAAAGGGDDDDRAQRLAQRAAHADALERSDALDNPGGWITWRARQLHEQAVALIDEQPHLDDDVLVELLRGRQPQRERCEQCDYPLDQIGWCPQALTDAGCAQGWPAPGEPYRVLSDDEIAAWDQLTDDADPADVERAAALTAQHALPPRRKRPAS